MRLKQNSYFTFLDQPWRVMILSGESDLIEADVRIQINQSLETKGWILQAGKVGRNVFVEQSVRHRLSNAASRELGQKSPDYTLFDGVVPIAIVEVKKPAVTDLEAALDQARDYAERVGAQIVFASNGFTLKSQFLGNGLPLYFNGIEVTEFPELEVLRRFHVQASNEVFTVPKEVIKSRDDLIDIFAELNDDLRTGEGLQAGVPRFTEFANILFLKLLSEKGDSDIWSELIRQRDEVLIDYLNNVAMTRLQENYGGEVITQTAIKNPGTLKKIVSALNPLQLTDIDEDIKGVAFEHFIQRTTTQNDLGEYFTPRHIVRFMVRLLNPRYGESVYDPFCGTGGFLTESFRHIGQQSGFTYDAMNTLNHDTVFGGEITTTARIAKMNMILFGDGHSGVTQQDSLRTNRNGLYDNVLSNIPFSQKPPDEVLEIVSDDEFNVKDADEACVMRCFKSLKNGGSMAVVVPEGLLVNRGSRKFLQFLLKNSRVRMLVRLPRGCFAPYTDAKTGILYLTDKGTSKTDWFYRATVENDGFDGKRNPLRGINDLDRILFSHDSQSSPDDSLPEELDISVVTVRNLDSENSFALHTDWNVDKESEYYALRDVAILNNGKSITEATTTEGAIPVIAGGRGSSPYTHGESNYNGNVLTVSKSGAYSGYVWWHDEPIWASDSIVVRSRDESQTLTKFLYMCMSLKQDEIYYRQQGTGQPHIYISHIEDFPVPIIPIEQQRLMLKEHEEVHAQVRRLEKERSAYRERINESIQSFYTTE